MTETEDTQKPGLQMFLDDTIAILGIGVVQTSAPATIRLLLPLWQQSKTPEAAAEYFRRAREFREAANFDGQLADARDGLRNHAYSTEQAVRKISEGITESMDSGGPVTGLLNVSYSAHELQRLGGLLRVYRDFSSLLDIVYASTLSAELALAVSKEDAVVRLVNMTEAERNSEGAGALEGLKKVIKILTNTL